MLTDVEKSDATNGMYETSYHYFIESLLLLTKTPLDQCEAMQYDNSSWFIKDDFLSRANILLNSGDLELSNMQLVELGIVCTLVGSVPCIVTNIPNERRAQELAMEHECWVPVRERSKILLELLRDETRRVESALSPKT